MNQKLQKQRQAVDQEIRMTESLLGHYKVVQTQGEERRQKLEAQITEMMKQLDDLQTDIAVAPAKVEELRKKLDKLRDSREELPEQERLREKREKLLAQLSEVNRALDVEKK